MSLLKISLKLKGKYRLTQYQKLNIKLQLNNI